MIPIDLRVLTAAALLLCCSCGGSTPGTTGAPTLASGLFKLKTSLVPPALKSVSAIRSGVLAQSTGPCAGIEGSDPFEVFLKCQPNLLRAYIAQVSRFIEEAYVVANDVGDTIDAAADGSQGRLQLEQDEVISWTKTSATAYSFDLSVDSEKLGTVSYNNGTISIALDGRYLEDEVTDEARGMFRIQAEFTTMDTWKVSAFLAGLPCQASDLNAPERMQYEIEFSATLWKAKVMTYHPRRSEDSCATAPTDSTAMNVYTDFVGDETATRANLYMLGRTVSSLSSISDFAFNRFCANYPAYCGGSASVYAEVGNPFCITSAAENASWSDDCSATSAGVATASSLEDSRWIVPSEFYAEAVPSLAW